MVVPCGRVYSVGEASAWAGQFLNALQAANLVEVKVESSVENFSKAPNVANEIPIVFIENTQDSRRWIQLIRDRGRRCFLVWFGRGFTKEDLHFAMEMRIYRVFENARAEDKALVSEIRKIAAAADLQVESEQIIHSIKATLLQDVGAAVGSDLVNEIKTAVTKLERGVCGNEFQAKATGPASGAEPKLPFYQEQGFGDALGTVHDLERTGILSVRGTLPGHEGHVEFLQGKIVGALTGQVRGLKAIYRMFLWDEPRFVFAKLDPDDLVLSEQLTLGMKYIRAEGESLKARFEVIRRELPPAELRLELEPNALHSGVKLPPDEFSTLSSVVEYGAVGRVIDYNPLPDVAIYESLIRLKRNQLIRVALMPVRSAA
jgi:hypothetical protein